MVFTIKPLMATLPAEPASVLKALKGWLTPTAPVKVVMPEVLTTKAWAAVALESTVLLKEMLPKPELVKMLSTPRVTAPL